MQLRRGPAYASLVLSVTFGAGCGGGQQLGGANSTALSSSEVDGGSASDAAILTETATSGVTTINVHYPMGQHSMAIRGDTSPLSWTSGIEMTAGSNNTWTYTVTLPSSVKSIQWKPVADDSTWSIGPNYVATRGATLDVYPHFFTYNGQVSQIWPSFWSNTLQNSRTVWMYVPPSYYENTTATFPVLYMQDGQSLFSVEPNLGVNGWQVDATLDAAATSGAIEELIVIAPECGTGPNQRDDEYTPTYDPSEGDGGDGDNYLTFLVSELKPQVDLALRTQTGKTTTGIMGSSLGGLISAYAGYTHADTFDIVGAMSPSTWWDNEVIVADIKKTPTSPRPAKVYVDAGDVPDDGDGLTETEELFAAYKAVGYKQGTTYDQVIADGAEHDETAWAARLPGALAFLFGPRAYLP